jgi:hypothetical protein
MANDRKRFNEIKEKLLAMGAQDIVLESGRKHKKMRFTAYGKRLLYCMSSSPSDRRVQQYILSDCRRMIRDAANG